METDRPSTKEWWLPALIRCVTMLCLISGSLFTLYRLFAYVRQSRCPSDSFGEGSLAVGGLVVLGALLFAILAPLQIFWDFVVGLIPGSRGFFAEGLSYRAQMAPYWKGFGRNARIAIFYVAVWLVPLSIAIVSNFSQFCLSPSEIVDRHFAWSGIETRPWSSVARIETSCEPQRRRNRWNTSYVLRFDDDTSIDLLGSFHSISDYRNGLHRSLEGHPYEFDNSRVSKDCNDHDVEMLMERP